MRTFKKAKVVMLPTNQKAKEGMIYLKPKIGIFNKTSSENHNNDVYDCNPQHLYIISDDKIKEGDWCINTGGNIKDSFPFRATKEVMNNKFIKKIIATTNSSLWRTSHKYASDVILLPQPSKQFIQKFVEEYNKGREIKEVLVEYEEIIYNPEKEREYQSNDRIYIEDCDKQTRLKINYSDNTITIKKVKDNYTREEHISNIKKFSLELGSKIHCFLKEDGTLSISIQDVNKWIEENL